MGEPRSGGKARASGPAKVRGVGRAAGVFEWVPKGDHYAGKVCAVFCDTHQGSHAQTLAGPTPLTFAGMVLKMRSIGRKIVTCRLLGPGSSDRDRVWDP